MPPSCSFEGGADRRKPVYDLISKTLWRTGRWMPVQLSAWMTINPLLRGVADADGLALVGALVAYGINWTTSEVRVMEYTNMNPI